MSEELKVDLEALGRLSPQLTDLAAKVSEAAGKARSAPSGDSPSAKAAQTVAGQVLPGVQKMVATRISNVADVVEQTRTQFGDTEEHIQASLASVGNLLPSANG